MIYAFVWILQWYDRLHVFASAETIHVTAGLPGNKTQRRRAKKNYSKKTRIYDNRAKGGGGGRGVRARGSISAR